MELFSLGHLYISDFLKINEEPESDPIELKLIMEPNTGAVKLGNPAPLSSMYGKYWYRSGINETMRLALKDIVESILTKINYAENDLWLDIACNDGTLLSFVPEDFIRVGIDPAEDSYRVESEKNSDLIIQDFFSKKVFINSKFGALKAKVITSIAMFYDLEEPGKFIDDVYHILDDEGIWVLQLSYTPLMIEQLAFDNICHEHIYYYSLFNLKKLLESSGMNIVDVQLNDINGGSFRVYAVKNNSNRSFFGSQPFRDVCNFRIQSVLEYESKLGMDKKETWLSFFEQINSLKKQVYEFIVEEKSKGKSIWAYGASTKGNTLLQYFGLDSNLIDGVAEKSIYKFGLKTVGTNIPIFSEYEMRQAKPDYLLVLPWHFIDEFKNREKNYLASGGKFIVPCPKFEIIES